MLYFLVEIMPTRLTYTDCFLSVNCFLFFMTKYFKDNCRYGKNKPFNRQPPPTNYQPPKTTMMSIFHMYFIDNLNLYILATSFWTIHIIPSNLCLLLFKLKLRRFCYFDMLSFFNCNCFRFINIYNLIKK